MVVAQPRLSPLSGSKPLVFWRTPRRNSKQIGALSQNNSPETGVDLRRIFYAHCAESHKIDMQLDWCCFGCIGGFKVIGHDLWQNQF
jgi:hypothetical protein